MTRFTLPRSESWAQGNLHSSGKYISKGSKCIKYNTFGNKIVPYVLDIFFRLSGQVCDPRM